jgi:MSHA type pilus biogenesis protein MshL
MAFKNFPLRTSLTSLVALSAFLPVSACDLSQNHLKIDRSGNAEFQDYRDALAPREAGLGDVGADGVADGDVPDLQAYVSENPEKQKSMPLVSLAVNQSVPLREALFELAKQANYDVELDPRISGSIIFTARNRPFDVVVDRICEIAGLRYKFEDDTLRIELDTPYSQNYKIDYLSFVRKSKSSMDTKVSVSGGEEATTNTGSSFGITSESEADFWGSLETNLKQILDSNATGSYLKTSQDPEITLTTSNPVQNPANPPVPPVDESMLKDGSAVSTVAPQAGEEIFAPMSVPSDGNAQPAATTPQADSSAPAASPVPSEAAAVPTSAPGPQPVGDAQQATPAPQETVLRVESLPTAATGGSPTNQNEVTFTPTFSINKQAGVVSVFANERLHKKVAEYLETLRRASTSQVLIEAKVLEVDLSDQFVTGINWEMLDNIGDFSAFSLGATAPLAAGVSPGINIGFVGSDLSSVVEALSAFGTVHALSSPRITVLNNQPAVLNVAENTVYFELDITRTPITLATGGTAFDTTVESTIKTIPEGILINVTPSINLDDNVISMQVRPTVSRITDSVPDPGAAYLGVDSDIPVVSVKEMDSVLRMKSGQMIVMGGLLEDRSSSDQSGVPVLSEIPLLGAAFRNQAGSVNKSELVVFLKATILKDPQDSIHQTDRELYRTFAQDRRPEKL